MVTISYLILEAYHQQTDKKSRHCTIIMKHDKTCTYRRMERRRHHPDWRS